MTFKDKAVMLYLTLSLVKRMLIKTVKISKYTFAFFQFQIPN